MPRKTSYDTAIVGFSRHIKSKGLREYKNAQWRRQLWGTGARAPSTSKSK